jgi:branched-chain amino acid transport system permease protein
MLVLALAALGLNILTGYAGQFSLGTAAFMSVGAFAAYNLQLRLPGIPLLVIFVLAGLIAAGGGDGVRPAVAADQGLLSGGGDAGAQFFVDWAVHQGGLVQQLLQLGGHHAQPMAIAGIPIETPVRRYLLVLSIVSCLALVAKNLARTRTGRSWMAVRDMDVAAEVIGIPILRTKLLAFGLSSFYCGVAGALWAFAYLGTVEPQAFDLQRSFQILFMVIIGGLGTVMGSFLGAAFIKLFPLFLNWALPRGGARR